jgi:hypothetical protein
MRTTKTMKTVFCDTKHDFTIIFEYSVQPHGPARRGWPGAPLGAMEHGTIRTQHTHENVTLSPVIFIRHHFEDDSSELTHAYEQEWAYCYK